MAKTKLPPDPDGMNDDRAGWAHKALVAFMIETGSDKSSAIRDLLGDLMHWCDRNGIDFNTELDAARYFYHAETSEGFRDDDDL